MKIRDHFSKTEAETGADLGKMFGGSTHVDGQLLFSEFAESCLLHICQCGRVVGLVEILTISANS